MQKFRYETVFKCGKVITKPDKYSHGVGKKHFEKHFVDNLFPFLKLNNLVTFFLPP